MRNKPEYANEEIYERIALKLKMSKSKVKDIIVNGFFKDMGDEIKSGCFNDISIPYLGKLKFNAKHFKAMNYYNKLK